MDTCPKDAALDASTWWSTALDEHQVELGQRIQKCLAEAIMTPEGCIELGSKDNPARVQWRGRRMRVYQLIAWGTAKQVPHPKSVIRHLCNNGACINPEHLAIGTQAQNLFDQRQKRAQDIARYWSHD